MDVILIILGVLGFGAIVIAAYVFTVAARNYVSDDDNTDQNMTNRFHQDAYIMRASRDRRQGIPVEFPMTVNSVVIKRDRRGLTERRAATA